MFPSIAEYTSALRHAESGTFRNLRLALSLDDEGEPIYSRGSYSVVFKAHSEGNEREEWAVKCYVAEQERRIPSCRAIAQQLNSITSPYLLPMRLCEEELRIGHTYYPLVLLPWVEGKSLVREVDCHLHNPERLRQLSKTLGILPTGSVANPLHTATSRATICVFAPMAPSCFSTTMASICPPCRASYHERRAIPIIHILSAPRATLIYTLATLL